jgi:hypothetical protein
MNTLANWTSAPVWAAWYSVDEDGQGCFWSRRPTWVASLGGKGRWTAWGSCNLTGKHEVTGDWHKMIERRP